MNGKIIGVTVGTSISPNSLRDKMNLSEYATEEWVREGYQPKGDYLTEHQDISGKLDANKLPEAINEALAQAKASGEFDGADGKIGADGVSATHAWNGTVLTVTSASGTSSADLRGAKGDKGDTGANGSDASVTADNIAAALGYTPANPSSVPSTTEILNITYDDGTTRALEVYVK